MDERVELGQYVVNCLEQIVSMDHVEGVAEVQLQQSLTRLKVGNVRACRVSDINLLEINIFFHAFELYNSICRIIRCKLVKFQNKRKNL